jgi:7,8-dihydro-6-hydroxymethylpterin-pyrophosphokinase
VTGIANLSRRAAHRSAVMMNYHQQIKRKLGQRYRLDPGMDDEQYVNALAGYNASINKDELLDLLKRLKRKNISEAEMVRLAVEASKWIDD